MHILLPCVVLCVCQYTLQNITQCSGGGDGGDGGGDGGDGGVKTRRCTSHRWMIFTSRFFFPTSRFSFSVSLETILHLHRQQFK